MYKAKYICMYKNKEYFSSSIVKAHLERKMKFGKHLQCSTHLKSSFWGSHAACALLLTGCKQGILPCLQFSLLGWLSWVSNKEKVC